MSNVIEVEFPRKPADRGGTPVTLDQSYVCPRCAAQLTTRKLWVDALINCRCGARMEAK